MNKPKKDIPSWKRKPASPLAIAGAEINKIILEERGGTSDTDTKPVLKTLLAEVTPDNIHGEISTGPVVGKEEL